MRTRNLWIFLAFASMVFLATGCPSSGSSAGYSPPEPDVQGVDQIIPEIIGQDTESVDSWIPDTAPDGIIPTDVVIPEDIEPTGCETDADCPEGYCNPTTQSCVECLSDDHCFDGAVCDGWVCVEAPACGPDTPCPEGLYCDLDKQTCVECLYDDHCAPNGACKEQECYYPCDNGCPDTMVCDETENLCVECLDDSHCLAEEWCFLELRMCLNDVCDPGKAGCVGDWTAYCAENGSSWMKDELCQEDTYCLGGECKSGEPLCDPGQTKCLNAVTLGVCGPNGNEWENYPCPSNSVCQGGECIEDCIPDCENKICGPDGCGGSCGDCDYGTCIEGWCEGPAICFEGETKCIDGGVAYCMGPEEGWSDPEPCPDGYYCEYGECVEQPYECEPGEAKCVGNGVSYCEDGYNWSPAKPCPPDSYCENGQCIPMGMATCSEVMACMEDYQCFDPDPFMCAPECFDVADPEGFEIAMELFYCVFESCGKWKPGSGCYNNAMNQGWCEELVYMCYGGCEPDCYGKQCGSDGCGGVCGVCPVGYECSADGQCYDSCIPQCDGKDCGPDGCGGTCGTCPSGTSCSTNGICIQTCTPDCQGKECGSDGCGGTCGLCGPGEACKFGQCEPSLSCKELLECMWSCYDDQCSNQCYQDASPDAQQQFTEIVTCIQEICGYSTDPQCQEEAINGPCYGQWIECQDCTPQCEGKQCGPDGCGGTCGNCPAGYGCDNYGYCICQPQCDGKECGNDGCGGSCGTCPNGQACSWQGQCVCMPDCENKECGGDGCGGSCGICPDGYYCTPDGFCEYDQQWECGNGWCQYELGESCETCPEDCGPCGGECGDGWCEEGFESCITCPQDCGPCGDGPCCEPHDETGCENEDITWCVCEFDPYCCQTMWDEICVNEAQEQCGLDCGCVPNCMTADGEYKECGSDGCGGTCGQCPSGLYCTDSGFCQYEQYADCGDIVHCMEEYYCYPEEPVMCAPECFENAPDDAAEFAMEAYYCVLDICGDWEPGTECHLFAKIEACKYIFEECTGECMPNCHEKECGPDGCGGYCGSCQGGQACINGKCEGPCEPSCITEWGMPKECGSDGCGGSCGDCPAGTTCDPDMFICVQVCVPNCDGKECGPDGCGGSCGECDFGLSCIDNQCVGAYQCNDMLECAMFECNFDVMCSMNCYQNGSDASKSAFQNLAMCVIQTCGYNVPPQCAEQAIYSQCEQEYEVCMDN